MSGSEPQALAALQQAEGVSALLASLGTHAATAGHTHQLMLALFELASVGIQLINVERKTSVAVNPAMVQITGYSREELMHGDPHQRFPAAYQGVREGWFRDVARSGRFGPSEVEYRHKDGHLINLLFSGVQVRDEHNHHYLWLNVQDVTRYRAMERELRATANQDRLTGLANRAALLRELQAQVDQARGPQGQPFVVMFLDFDRFKVVNDTLGHAAGDELLCAIAQRLRQATAARSARPPGLAARLGGDEFVLLLPGLADEAAAIGQAEALLQVLAAPYSVKQQVLHSSASIGIVCWRDEGQPAETLLRDADIAMYEAKRRGRGQLAVFDRSMHDRLTRAAQVEAELRMALQRQQLSLAYQPIVDLQTGRMSSAEALLRWTHPSLGAVSPAEFIPLAEDSGQIAELGAWVLREACRAWAGWQQQDPLSAPTTVSVNLSRVQLAHGQQLLALVQDTLTSVAMPPSALQLEITEREVMRDPPAARALMQALAVMGVKLAMDDFGTGTSSLGCLRDYPFHTIKIDRSLVSGLFQDPQMLAVAHATVNVIENLGMASVAEGVEHPSEAATLQALGCRHAQGWLFARAVPAGQLLAALPQHGPV